MRMSRPARIAAALVAAGLFTAAPAPAGPPAEVNIRDFTYGPRELDVPVGTVVTWTNHDEETHTITSTGGAFASAGLAQDETFTQTFTRPGRYTYFCALHPRMQAVVVVH